MICVRVFTALRAGKPHTLEKIVLEVSEQRTYIHSPAILARYLPEPVVAQILEGAELVARTINELFSALLGTLADWGGNLLKLSGDALTVLFSGPSHARRAV